MAADLLARALAARTFATARASTIAVEEFGARPTGDSRAAVQRAIDLAVANGIPHVTSRLPRMEIWEPVLDDPNGTGAAWFARNRTLRIPACDALDLDFGGAQLTLKGPTGGAPLPGQVCPSLAGFGGFWSGGFLTVTGIIKRLRVANVTCNGGYGGNAVAGEGINLLHKGFLCQDIGDANFGPGNGFGTLIMDNVTLHSFAAEIMYDNSSREMFSTNCHFYNSPQSCWNPSGIGGGKHVNLQAGQSSQVAEILGGKGHTYIGGRFYNSGGGGSTVIGGPDPTFCETYATPRRRTDAPPPYVEFIGTRFEDYGGFLYLGSYMRGNIYTTDVALFIAQGFASNGTLQDIDLDVYATADRKGNYNAVQVAGPASDDGTQPHNVNVRVHCAETRLAASAGGSISYGLSVSNLVHAPSCSFAVDGVARSAFTASGGLGFVMPLIDSTGFRANGNQDYLYFSTSQTFTIASSTVNLYPQAAGTFDFTLNPVPSYMGGQEFTFFHDGSGAGDRIVSFAQSGAGMRLNATRTLRRAGDYLKLRRSEAGATWVEAAFVGDEGPQTIPVLAAAMIPNLTNGPAPGLTESGTNKVMLATLDFDATTAESAQIAIPMPRSWNEGTVRLQFVWTAGASGSTVWGCQALALSDDDAVDAAFGTSQLVTDAVTGVGDIMESALTAPITIAGTPAPDDLVVLRLYRDATHAADTLAADARLVAVRIHYTADAGNDA
jgi:hypothetical protein